MEWRKVMGGAAGPDRRSALRHISRLSPSARVAVRLAGVAALAAGGIVVGRGVASFAAEHTSPATAMAANVTDVRTTSVNADASAAPAFTSYLRSWVVSPPGAPAEAPAPPIQAAVQPPAVQAAAPPPAATALPADPGTSTIYRSFLVTRSRASPCATAWDCPT